MSDRDLVMWSGPAPTPMLAARWRANGAVIGLQIVPCLDDEGKAFPWFRSLWRAAFPYRRPLPDGPLRKRDGTFTDAMLSVWL